MSVQAITWAYGQQLRSVEKFVLVTLANYADQWGVCWPLQSTLVDDTGYGERTVRDALSALEEAGAIARVSRRRPDGSRMSDAFVIVGFEGRKRARSVDDHPTINLLDIDNAADNRTSNRQDMPDDNRQDTPVQPAAHCQTNRQDMPDTIEPSSEPSNEPSEDDEERVRAGAFADFVDQMAEALGEPGIAANEFWILEAKDGRFRSAWADLGLNEAQMLDVAKRFGHDMPDAPKGPKALDKAMSRAAKAAKADAAGRRGKRAVVHASIDDRVAFWHAKLNAGGYIPSNAFGSEVRNGLISAGHFTDAQLRARGL